MAITKATRDVLDLSVRPVTAIDMNCTGTNLVDNVQIGTRTPNLGYFTNMRANSLQINTSGTLDLSNSGVSVLGKLRAYYADVAERYESDASYEAGTILCFGGSSEVTIAKQDQSDILSLAGVVSSDPFMILNQGLEDKDCLQVKIALIGRIPCRVVGPVRAGEYIQLSNIPGVGMAVPWHGNDTVGQVIKTDERSEERLVEIKVSA